MYFQNSVYVTLLFLIVTETEWKLYCMYIFLNYFWEIIYRLISNSVLHEIVNSLPPVMRSKLNYPSEVSVMLT